MSKPESFHIVGGGRQGGKSFRATAVHILAWCEAWCNREMPNDGADGFFGAEFGAEYFGDHATANDLLAALKTYIESKGAEWQKIRA